MMPSMSAICLAKLNVQSSPSTFTWVWIPVFMMLMGLEISDGHTQAQPQRIVMRWFPPKGILWAKNSPRNMSTHAGIVKQGYHYTNLPGYPSLNPFLLVNPVKNPMALEPFTIFCSLNAWPFTHSWIFWMGSIFPTIHWRNLHHHEAEQEAEFCHGLTRNPQTAQDFGRKSRKHGLAILQTHPEHHRTKKDFQSY